MILSEFSALVELVRERFLAFLALNSETILALPFESAILTVARIAERNIENGRFKRYSKKWRESEPLTLTLYIDRLIQYWVQEYPRVQRLKDGNSAEWNALGEQLERPAKRWLSNLGSKNPSERSPEDIVQETLLKVFSQPFPFEIKFERWVLTILRNVVIAVTRSGDVLAQSPLSLDRTVQGLGSETEITLGELLPDTKLDELVRVLDRDLLTRVFEQMNNSDFVQVLQMRYLEDLTFSEIALRIKCTTAYVYVLHWRAAKLALQLIQQGDLIEKRPRKHQKQEGARKRGHSE